MKKAKGIKIGGAVLVIALVFTILWQIGQAFTSKEPLTRAEASELVQEKYNGSILDISEQSDVFHIKFAIDTGEYEVEMNRDSGEIRNLTRLVKETPPQEKVLTEAEIKEKVAQQQPGEIEKLEQKQEGKELYYYVIVRHETKRTSLKMDAYSGEIVDTTTEEIKQPEQPAKRLTEAEAIQIALQSVSGKVDDIELEQSGGTIYYLIEIKREEDEDATVQVNALLGEVMSVTWED
jgi:uncharacterized membrane protein YkoI